MTGLIPSDRILSILPSFIFVAPLVVATLSPFLLKERIGVYRILAVIFGFVGALILLRPLFVGEGLGYLIGLLSGIAFGIYYTANRRTATAQSSSINRYST